MSAPESIPAEAVAPIEELPQTAAEPTNTETPEPAVQIHHEPTPPVTEPGNQVLESQNNTQNTEQEEPGELPQLDQSSLQALWLAQHQHLLMQQQPDQNTQTATNIEESGNQNLEAQQQALAAFLLQQQQHQENVLQSQQQAPNTQFPPNPDQNQIRSMEYLPQHDEMQLEDARDDTKRQPAPATGPMRGPERSRREEPYPTRSARGGRDPIEVLRETRALYMAGVPPEASDGDVLLFFRDYRPKGARVPRFDDSGKAKGFAFIDFSTFEDAKNALDRLQESVFMGRTVKLQPSDTPIRHNDPDGVPRHDRRPERKDREREFGRGGWDRDRERDRDYGRDFHRGGSDRGDSYREREYDREYDRDYGRGDGRRGGPREDHFRDSESSRRTSLFIGNLDDRTTDRDVFNLFSTCGRVRNIRLLSDKTGRSRGCGFVDFERPEDAARGMSLSGTRLHGREIRVDFSQPELKSGRGAPDREFRDRDRDRDRGEGRDSYRDRSYSPPRHDSRDMGPPRGYPPQIPPPGAPAPPMDPFAQLAQVPGLLHLLNPQAAALAAAAAAAQQQQQPSNDLSSLLRSLGGGPAPTAPQDANLAYLQAIMAAGGAQGQQMPRTSAPYDQQANQLSSLLGMGSGLHQQPQAPQSYQQYPQHQHDDYRSRPPAGGAPPMQQMGPKYNPSTQPISKRPPGCKSVFLAALPDTTTEADVRGIFEQCGKVERIRWLNDRTTGRFRGCGFVDFYDEVGPVKAVNFNGALIHGVPIRVDYAIPKQFE